MSRCLRIALWLLTCAVVPVDAQQVDTLAIRGHSRFLADDQLAGRGTGTEGERLAAAYIASQLERLGLRPLGGDTTFLLPLPLRAARIHDESEVVIQGADTTTFSSGDGFIVNTGGAGAFRDFRGRAIFFGQPAQAADAIAAERSLVGRVAVFTGALGAAALDIVPALSHAGVAGIILLVPDPEQFDLYRRSRGAERFFVDAPVDDPVWQPSLPVLLAGPALSAALMSGVQQRSQSRSQVVDLGRTVVARIRADVRPVPAANVAGVLTGSDPVLRDQFIVYTAHYDHLGVSTPDQNGDSIYNGFSDNAAGVSMLLAIAEAMRANPPARSVAFLFFTGEERGLLGSSYLAAAPPMPLDRITALINLDAGAPPAPPVSWRIAGDVTAALGEAARAFAVGRGWSVTLSPASPNSDYWPFLRRNVPSIFIIPGDQWENTSTEQRDALRRRWDRYHQAGDHWRDDFPFAGLARYADFALLLGLRLAGGS